MAWGNQLHSDDQIRGTAKDRDLQVVSNPFTSRIHCDPLIDFFDLMLLGWWLKHQHPAIESTNHFLTGIIDVRSHGSGFGMKSWFIMIHDHDLLRKTQWFMFFLGELWMIITKKTGVSAARLLYDGPPRWGQPRPKIAVNGWTEIR